MLNYKMCGHFPKKYLNIQGIQPYRNMQTHFLLNLVETFLRVSAGHVSRPQWCNMQAGCSGNVCLFVYEG